MGLLRVIWRGQLSWVPKDVNIFRSFLLKLIRFQRGDSSHVLPEVISLAASFLRAKKGQRMAGLNVRYQPLAIWKGRSARKGKRTQDPSFRTRSCLPTAGSRSAPVRGKTTHFAIKIKMLINTFDWRLLLN